MPCNVDMRLTRMVRRITTFLEVLINKEDLSQEVVMQRRAKIRNIVEYNIISLFQNKIQRRTKESGPGTQGSFHILHRKVEMEPIMSTYAEEFNLNRLVNEVRPKSLISSQS